MSSYTKFNLVMKLKKEMKEEAISEIKDIMSHSCSNDTYCHISKGAINLRGMFNYKFDKVIRIFELIEECVYVMPLKRIGTLNTEAIPMFSQDVDLYCHHNKIFVVLQEEENVFGFQACHYNINDLRDNHVTFTLEGDDCNNTSIAFSKFLFPKSKYNKDYYKFLNN